MTVLFCSLSAAKTVSPIFFLGTITFLKFNFMLSFCLSCCLWQAATVSLHDDNIFNFHFVVVSRCF